jgi:predicted DNA-binding transcriptional regulator AlpA
MSASPDTVVGYAVDKNSLAELLGFSPHNSTLIDWEAAGTFPKRFRLPGSPRALWVRDEILAYLKGAAADRTKRAFASAATKARTSKSTAAPPMAGQAEIAPQPAAGSAP